MNNKLINNRPVLVFIDDETHILKTLNRLTKTLDADCHFFNSPQDGLQFVRENSVDIVITDYNMPSMNGVELLSEISRIIPESIRIIITGYADSENILQAVNEAKIWGFIEKPWDNEQFMSAIHSAIKFRNQIRDRINKRYSELEKSASEAQLENRLKSEFLAVMSHEIRTPMTSIMGALNLLTESNLDQTQSQLVDQASQAGNGLLRLLTDMLTYSKLESDYYSLSVKQCDIAQEIQQVTEQFYILANQKNIQLIIDTSALGSENFYTDTNSFRQIIVNLLDNALKFTKAGTVSITVEFLKENEYQLNITDTGFGIDNVEGIDIFSKFTQVELGYARTHEGAGLGLSICKQLVEKLGGKIGYESERGKGTRFWFTLINQLKPYEYHKEQLQNETIQFNSPVPDYEPSVEELNFLKNKKLLLVEDSSANQLIIQSMLDSTKLDVFLANDGLEAIELIKHTEVDIVLMDLSMPRMDGAEASKIIREQLKLINLPIIALTANVELKDIKHCLASGMTDFATKPVDKTYLINCICYYVNRLTISKPELKDSAATPKQDNYVNQEILGQLESDTSKEMQKKIIKMYLDEMNKRAEIISSCSEDDLLTLKNEAHAIKSSSYTLGAIKTADLAKSLEQTCAASDFNLSLNLTNDLLESIKHTQLQLTSYLE